MGEQSFDDKQEPEGQNPKLAPSLIADKFTLEQVLAGVGKSLSESQLTQVGEIGKQMREICVAGEDSGVTTIHRARSDVTPQGLGDYFSIEGSALEWHRPVAVVRGVADILDQEADYHSRRTTAEKKHFDSLSIEDQFLYALLQWNRGNLNPGGDIDFEKHTDQDLSKLQHSDEDGPFWTISNPSTVQYSFYRMISVGNDPEEWTFAVGYPGPSEYCEIDLIKMNVTTRKPSFEPIGERGMVESDLEVLKFACAQMFPWARGALDGV